MSKKEEAADAPKKRGLDPELQAMAKIDRILAELDDKQKSRVLTWLVARTIPTTISLNRLPERPEMHDECGS